MIQSFLKDKLSTILPQLEWTQDFYTAEDNSGTVYSEGGLPPDTYDPEIRYPQYMVFIRSTDWALAEAAARKVQNELHKKANLVAEIEYGSGDLMEKRTYQVFLIQAMGEPLRLGVQDEVMEYSINFQVTLREMNK